MKTAFVRILKMELAAHANAEIAEGQMAYMRHKFLFYGIKTQQRRALFKPFIQKEYLPSTVELPEILMELWQQPQREFQMCGIDLALKYKNKLVASDLKWLTLLVVNKSWWDTVDMLATHMLGAYFLKFPELRRPVVDEWIASNNIWLQRCAILFQLKYKSQLDTALLSQVISSLIPSEEFFINKAIGWVLREYSKTNPNWVASYVSQTPLSSLSKKEALRRII